MDKKIVIKPNFEINEYFKVNLYIHSRNPIYFIILIFFTLMIFSSLILFLTGTYSNLDIHFDPTLLTLIIWPFLMLFLIYLKTKKTLENPKIKENIHVHYNNTFFEEIGETFNIKYYWKDIKKITETKK